MSIVAIVIGLSSSRRTLDLLITRLASLLYMQTRSQQIIINHLKAVDGRSNGCGSSCSEYVEICNSYVINVDYNMY